MGQAKRKHDSGEADFWYHGTNEYFESWGQPPVISKYKKELLPHSFISLTKNMELAAGAGGIAKGLCRSKLASEARVLDLRTVSEASKKHWEMVLQTELGCGHAKLQTFHDWTQACISGDVMRMHTMDREFGEKMTRYIHVSRNASFSLRERAEAHLIVQNFTRQWIETVLSPARSAGYEAVICSEIDSDRPSKPKACTNLHVFSPAALTVPEWVSKSGALLTEHELNRLKEFNL